MSILGKDVAERVIEDCRVRAKADVEKSGYGESPYPYAFGSLSACYRITVELLIEARAKLDDDCWEAQQIDKFLNKEAK